MGFAMPSGMTLDEMLRVMAPEDTTKVEDTVKEERKGKGGKGCKIDQAEPET